MNKPDIDMNNKQARPTAQTIQQLHNFAFRYGFLSLSDTAKVLGKSKNALERMRWNGSGPNFRRCGSNYFYRLVDIEEWLRPDGETESLLAHAQLVPEEEPFPRTIH